MSKPYGISGTPWHVERIHNNDPKDARRHRSKCAFYVKSSKTCRKQLGLCVGASHCKYYRERDAATITVEDTETDYTPAFNKSVDTHKTIASESKHKRIDPHLVRPGVIVTVNGKRYLVQRVSITHNLMYRYTCRRIEKVSGADILISKSRVVYDNLILSQEQPCEFLLTQIEKVSTIPAKAVSKLARQNIVHDNSRATIPPTSPPEKENAKVEESVSLYTRTFGRYKYVVYEGKIKDIIMKKLKLMFIPAASGKKIPVSLDEENNILYVSRPVFHKYKDIFLHPEKASIYPYDA